MDEDVEFSLAREDPEVYKDGTDVDLVRPRVSIAGPKVGENEVDTERKISPFGPAVDEGRVGTAVDVGRLVGAYLLDPSLSSSGPVPKLTISSWADNLKNSTPSSGPVLIKAKRSPSSLLLVDFDGAPDGLFPELWLESSRLPSGGGEGPGMGEDGAGVNTGFAPSILGVDMDGAAVGPVVIACTGPGKKGDTVGGAVEGEAVGVAVGPDHGRLLGITLEVPAFSSVSFGPVWGVFSSAKDGDAIMGLVAEVVSAKTAVLTNSCSWQQLVACVK